MKSQNMPSPIEKADAVVKQAERVLQEYRLFSSVAHKENAILLAIQYLTEAFNDLRTNNTTQTAADGNTPAVLSQRPPG